MWAYYERSIWYFKSEVKQLEIEPEIFFSIKAAPSMNNFWNKIMILLYDLTFVLRKIFHNIEHQQ